MSTIRMASVDAAWLRMDRPDNELVVNAVLSFDGCFEPAGLGRVINERLVGRHARFAQRVEERGRTAWWVDDEQFDVAAHIAVDDRDAPAGRDELQQRLSRLVSVPLERGRPLWHIHVLAGLNGETVLLARVHHCIADGVALFRALLSLTDETDRDQREHVGAAAEAPARPQAGVRTLLRSARAVGELCVLPPDRRTALSGPLGTAKSVTWSRPISLAAVRTSARGAGVTINDLLLAGLAAATRTHLGAAGGPVRDVRAVLPVNLRPYDPHAVELGNRFGLAFLRLPVTAPDRHARIAQIHARTAALKRSATAVVAFGIITLVGHAPRWCVQTIIRLFSAKGSMVVTNVPGPSDTLHLLGRPLTGVVAWPPQSGSVGVGVSLISYAGQLVIGVMTDDRLVPDPNAFLDAVCAEFDQDPSRAIKA